MELRSLKLWQGKGKGCHFDRQSNGALKNFVQNHLEEAKQVKQERRNSSSRRAVIKSLAERRLHISEKLTGYDKTDIVGLVGEIVSEDFLTSGSLEPIFLKWRYTGTSKSKGIDLVARNNPGKTVEVVLCEAKHPHDEIRDLKIERCHSLIGSKFRLGIDEFEHEKTLLNLASILIHLGTVVRLEKAISSNASLAQEHYAFISECLRKDSYCIYVLAVVDARYCNADTLDRCTIGILDPAEINSSHPVTLTLIQSGGLEQTTDEMCDSYVGAI